MSHHHKHPEPCKHALDFCAKCELPFCTKCGKEWAEPCNKSHYSWNWIYPYSQPRIGTWGDYLTTGGTMLKASQTIGNTAAADSVTLTAHTHTATNG